MPGASLKSLLRGRGVALGRVEIDELVVKRLQVDAQDRLTAAAVDTWVAGYERAWRTAGTAQLAALFSADATYSPGPYSPTARGIAAIGELWEEGRDGPDEQFTLRHEPVAVDDQVAVVRTEVSYGIPERQQYRNLWVLRFADDGRVRSFEEWPFFPGQPRAADA